VGLAKPRPTLQDLQLIQQDGRDSKAVITMSNRPTEYAHRMNSFLRVVILGPTCCLFLYGIVTGHRMIFVAAGVCIAGGLSNLIVIKLNDDLMPIRLGSTGQICPRGYRRMDDTTNAWWLGDWIPVRGWLCSPGDVLWGVSVLLALVGIGMDQDNLLTARTCR
jgi:hypothetical protein